MMVALSLCCCLIMHLTSWHWFHWDICIHWIGPNPHLHCIIVRLGIPSYWCWLLMLILHSSTTIYTMEKIPTSNGPLFMLLNARRITFGFSFKHSMASNKLDTSGIKIGRHPNQNGLQSLVLESLYLFSIKFECYIYFLTCQIWLILCDISLYIIIIIHN